MFDFRKISLSDKDRVKEALAVSDFRGCEYSFANNCSWHRLADTVVCFEEGFYIPCSFYGGEPVITLPSGAGRDDKGRERYISLFAQLRKYVEDQGKIFRLGSVTEQDLSWISECYGGSFEAEFSRDYSDYIYSVRELTELRGSRFHGKRNHIKRFKETEWSYSRMTPEDFDSCIAFASEGYAGSGKYDDRSAALEQLAIHTFFENYEAFGLCGGVLRQSGRLVGFTLGERLNSDTFVVHVEKALPQVQGAYPTLCNEFLKAEAQGLEYVNREEDLGIEGLRRSKLSYHPEFLLDKYTLTFKN